MSSKSQFPPPPVFGVLGDDKANKTGIYSLVDIFDDFLFSGDKGLGNNAGQKEDDDDFDSHDDDGDDSLDGKRRKRSRQLQRNMTEEQKIERRERNREHAKRSRVRKKFLLESLQHSVKALEEENEKLRRAVREHCGEDADGLLGRCSAGGSLLSGDSSSGTVRLLDDPDYSLVKALQTAQQNFVISDPSLPDNPIVYASQGFLSLTGYTLPEVLGRNCRFLQGPDTDPVSVARIRGGIERGEDTTVVLLNYRKDGSPFWNQFFIAALRDGDGSVVNYLGVQCKVSEEYARAYIKQEDGGVHIHSSADKHT